MAGYFQVQRGGPGFRWNDDILAGPLAAVRRRQRRLSCRSGTIGMEVQADAVLRSLADEILKTSEIEGELLDRDQVLSCLAQRLSIDACASVAFDQCIEGVVEMTLDATQNYAAPLTAKRLLGWHGVLFPAGRGGMSRIAVAAGLRDATGAIKVVSGPIGGERVRCRATSAVGRDRGLTVFVDWFNATDDVDPFVFAAIAHFWFVAIRPFDDGNGRIARAISEMALARSEQGRLRFFSMSAQIRAERAAYYDILQTTLTGGQDITAWIEWFLACLDRAIGGAESKLASHLPSPSLPRA